jgi:hypothetical protein
VRTQCWRSTNKIGKSCVETAHSVLDLKYIMRCIHLQWMMKGHPHMSEIHREQKRLSWYMKNARYVWDVNSGLHDVKEGEKGVSLVSPRQEAGHSIWAMNTHPSATTVHNLKNQRVWDDYPQFCQAQFYQAFVSKIVERSLIVGDVNWVPWPCRSSLFLQRRVPAMSSIFSTAPLV